jgi:C4-dicarboxylate-specific signal transduction histidine kinase
MDPSPSTQQHSLAGPCSAPDADAAKEGIELVSGALARRVEPQAIPLSCETDRTPSATLSHLVTRMESLSAACALAVGIIGLLMLAGWAFRIEFLIQAGSRVVTMRANTALGFALAGTALWLAQSKRIDHNGFRAVCRAFAAALVLMGLFTLIEYVFRLDLGIDQFLFPDTAWNGPRGFPGRPAPNTAAGFVLIGLAVMLLDVETRDKYRPAEFLACVLGYFSAVTLAGYAYGISDRLFFDGTYKPMALGTAMTMALATFGVLCARPDRGFMAVLTSRHAGGRVARRFLLPVVSLPLVSHLCLLVARRLNWINDPADEVLDVVVITFGFLALLWITAASLNRMDAVRRTQEAAVVRLNAELEQRVRERTLELEVLNDDLKSRDNERQQAEQALHESDERLRLALASGEMATWNWDILSNATVWTGRCPAMAAIPPDTLTSYGEFLNAIHPEDREKVRRAVAQALEHRQPYEVEMRMVAPDGTVRWMAAKGQGFYDERGQAVRMTGIALDVTERKRVEQEIQRTQEQLMLASRQAGMAEVATGVLHNVGNVLTSINVAASVALDRLKQSKASYLGRVAALLQEHKSGLADYLLSDPKGRQLPDYLIRLAQQLAEEHLALARELDGLRQNVDHVKEIVAMQQNYARVGGGVEHTDLARLMEDALRLEADSLQRRNVRVVREFDDPAPRIVVDKHKVLQVLVNLIRNAKFACEESERTDKRLVLRIGRSNGRVRIAVADNGVGIAPENMQRLFTHGFTTRKEGHGFGLHSCALTVRELRGTLCAHSDGPGTGATFTLELPSSAGKECESE